MECGAVPNNCLLHQSISFLVYKISEIWFHKAQNSVLRCLVLPPNPNIFIVIVKDMHHVRIKLK